MLLPVGDKIAPLSLPIPAVFFEPDVCKTARSACSRGRTGVLFTNSGRVLYTEGEMGKWRFSRTIVLAEPNDNGAPSDATLIGTEHALVALWQRTPKDGSRFRIELVANDGSGWK